MHNNIKKIINSIGSKYLLLLLLVIISAVSTSNINAIGLPDKMPSPTERPMTKIDPNVSTSFTYRPPSPVGDYVTFTYTPNKGLSYKGLVTLNNGCEFVEQNSLNYINYLVDPGPNAPVLSYNLIIGSKPGICTQALQLKPFSGELKSVNLTDYQLINLKKYITINWTRAEKEPLVDTTDYSKLKWEESNSEYIATNNYRFFLKNTYSRDVPKAGECIVVTTFFGGSNCKTVEVRNYKKRNNLVTIAKDKTTLRKYFGAVNSLTKAHFISDVIRNQLFDGGEAKMDNKYFVRVFPDCSADIVYYQLVTSPTSYDFKLIKRVEGGNTGGIRCT